MFIETLADFFTNIFYAAKVDQVPICADFAAAQEADTDAIVVSMETLSVTFESNKMSSIELESFFVYIHFKRTSWAVALGHGQSTMHDVLW